MNLLAQITNPVLEQQSGEDGVTFIQKLLTSIIGIFFAAGFIIFVFMLLIGAIQWIASGGDKTALEGARGKISSALIGLVILISVFAIIKLVENFFGINILSIDISSLKIQ